MFNINQRFRVIHRHQLTGEQIEVLTTFYLPIIGKNAYALFMSLSYWPETSAPQTNHTVLLQQLALNQATFMEARAKLEGMGLLNTYQQDLNNITQWTYQLGRPNSAQSFLSEPLLASLLTHYIGQTQYEQLVARYQPDTESVTGKNVTQTFFDMIGNNHFQRIQPQMPATKDTVSLDFKINEQQKLNLDLMADMLKLSGVKLADLKRNESELLLIKQLYALDDMQLVRDIQATLDSNGKLDLVKLRARLAARFQSEQQPVNVLSATPIKPVTKSDTQTAENTAEGKAHPLIIAATTMSPLSFLAKLRQEKNGFVTISEQKNVTQAVEAKFLPNEVLNILIYQLVVRENRSSLSQALLQTVVNDWRQAGIKTAKEALNYLKQRESNANNAGGQRRYQNSGRRNQGTPKAKETRPDWENQKATPASQNDLKATQATLAKLNARISANKNQENNDGR